MNFPFYIARRHLFAKKSSSVISAISIISMVGVAVATAAMVIVLSVFNGFQEVVESFFTTFDPQVKIVPLMGKTVAADDSLLLRVKSLPEVDVVSECYEDKALAVYQGRQAMVTLKGVDDSFQRLTQIQSICYGDGEFSLHAANLDYGTPGILLAQALGTGTRWSGYLSIYVPVREGEVDIQNPTESFVADSLLSSGVVFQVTQPKYDENYILVPISFVRNLYFAQGEITSLEIKLKAGSSVSSVCRKMRTLAGSRFRVMDRYEQQSDTYNIMRIEKLLAFIFLSFILMVASFNIIGTLSMLIIDKRADIVTLHSLGATPRQITSIFLFEGRLIAAIGAIVGIAVGLLLCWLQIHYGFVRMGSSDGTFVVDAYPVSVHLLDIVLVFFTVILISWMAVWYPVRQFAKRELR